VPRLLDSGGCGFDGKELLMNLSRAALLRKRGKDGYLITEDGRRFFGEHPILLHAPRSRFA
jgi:hypothetical protein